MQYTPTNENAIAAMRLLPEGEYPFEVSNAADGKSKKSGKDMITLELSIFLPDGRRSSVTDYIVPGTPFSDKKLFEFAKTTGLSSKYETGSISAEDCLGKSGYLKLGVDKGKKMDNSERFFNDKNAVKWYIVKPTAKAPEPSPQTVKPDVVDDDVPF